MTDLGILVDPHAQAREIPRLNAGQPVAEEVCDSDVHQRHRQQRRSGGGSQQRHVPGLGSSRPAIGRCGPTLRFTMQTDSVTGGGMKVLAVG